MSSFYQAGWAKTFETQRRKAAKNAKNEKAWIQPRSATPLEWVREGLNNGQFPEKSA
jgi:hypothetical protein